MQDPPISKIDLLVCRNTLMYFSSDVQRHVLSSFHFAVNRGGYLFLGKSEALVTRTALFETVDVRRHIFRKDGSREDNGYIASQLANMAVPPSTLATFRVGDRLLEQSPIAQLVVDAEARGLHANLSARRLFSLGSADTNMVLRNGEVLVHRELQPLLEQVVREGKILTVPEAAQSGNGDSDREYDMILVPLQDAGGIGVSFVDVSRYRTLHEDLERAQRELESAYEELQSAIEELETTNEELQSTNEELETTNEELQSTNEELETMNEELQSTNEELETINNELRERSTELDELNVFLQCILGSLRSAVVVLGPEMEVRAWNRRAEDLWGLRGEEVEGQHFLNLDIGFPVESVGPAIRSALAGRTDGAQATMQAVNRRGRTISCKATISPLVTERSVRGVIVLMDVIDGEETARNAG